MTVDDLTTPLGQRPAQRRREFPVSVPKVVAAALALFLCAFVVWAFVGDDPFGGEPKVAVPIDQRGLAAANKPDAAAPQVPVITNSALPQSQSQQTETQQGRPALPPGTKTVTIIDGKTGERRQVLIPAGSDDPPTGAFSKGAKQ
jgi:uncharacterized protein